MNREQIIRDTAYAIWEAEGRPDGKAERHWSQAEKQVAGMTEGKTKAAKDQKEISPRKAPAKTSRTKTGA